MASSRGEWVLQGNRCPLFAKAAPYPAAAPGWAEVHTWALLFPKVRIVLQPRDSRRHARFAGSFGRTRPQASWTRSRVTSAYSLTTLRRAPPAWTPRIRSARYRRSLKDRSCGQQRWSAPATPRCASAPLHHLPAMITHSVIGDRVRARGPLRRRAAARWLAGFAIANDPP